MAQTAALVGVLKQALKAQSLQYKDVGEALGLSEASVKRLFSTRQFTLQRLDSICALLGMELTDLFDELKKQNRPQHLSEEQEKQLVADPSLLIVASSVLNRWSFSKILATYQFEETELIKYMAQLDRLKLIDLLPKNRIKLRVARNFSWLANGPIQRYFEAQMQADFLQSRFSKPGEKRFFITGMLSRASNGLLQEKMQRLIDEFTERNVMDEKLPADERFGTSMLVAMRHWEPAFFEARRRRPDERVF